jgi:hypothetical protein
VCDVHTEEFWYVLFYTTPGLKLAVDTRTLTTRSGKYVAEIRNKGASIKSYMDDKLREQIFVLANSMLSNKPGLAVR